MFNDFVE